MWIERLAREIGALGQEGSSTPERAVDRLSTVAARGVPGCSAALVVVWRAVERGDGDDVAEHPGGHVVVDYGASHSDLAAAFEHQYATDQGPAVEAVREMRPVSVGDVLRGDRWPRYTSMAVQCGDRSSVTLPRAFGDEVLTLGVHSGRADAFDPVIVQPLIELLAEQATAMLLQAGRYSDAEREAAHMRRAMSSRGVIDQAKGIIMHARGCDADEAFRELRRVAQRNRMKVAEVARKLVEEHAAGTTTGPRRVAVR
ncbi:ANTAR domain-containing protein [Marinactinospora thermotolerans]|uniref:Response regulator with putative antiterminator output domain n=1 Tax=Marinactinospora thermotolerans DSM 45154 TaxID=1122192 RepID=A0A1T4TAK3_9ACTN|nr:GAF and ANTAR domain-containing protein [Marinactinospora thermotolerans]SKA37545.1 Response regulator with putative antiterminator output domain [Marinactinospora thermotolerans DSM 45154]